MPQGAGGPSGGPAQAFLNECGKDGWELVSQNEGRVFYFKRSAN
jgi:hypothetical protein